MSIWTARLLNDYDRPEGLRIVREAADMHPQGRVTERNVDKLVRPDEGQQLRESYAPLPALSGDPDEIAGGSSACPGSSSRAEPLLGSEWLRGHETAMLGLALDRVRADLGRVEGSVRGFASTIPAIRSSRASPRR